MFMLGTVELPVTVDVAAPMSDSIMLVAGVIGVAVGVYIVFKVVKIGLSWASAALGSEPRFVSPFERPSDDDLIKDGYKFYNHNEYGNDGISKLFDSHPEYY